MNLDNAIARPRSRSTHDLSCMGPIVFPVGETLSSPQGEFLFYPSDIPISPMETVEETRRNRLRMLVKKFGSMASLCEKLGYARNETAGLTRILNANVRHDRDGKPYNMGSPMAREIEEKLTLPAGWMDTPPTYSEIFGEEHAITKTLRAMERLPTYLQESAASLILGLKKSHDDHFVQINDNSVKVSVLGSSLKEKTPDPANNKLTSTTPFTPVFPKKTASKRGAFKLGKMPTKSTVFVDGKAVVLTDFNGMVDNAPTADLAKKQPSTKEDSIKVHHNSQLASKQR